MNGCKPVSLSQSWTGPIAALALGLPAAALFFWPEATAALQFERAAVDAGQLWRLVTGHWTHWTADHLIWDLFVFLALGWACVRVDRRAAFRCVAASSLAIGLGVWLATPALTTYRGLSGVDSALFTLFARQLATRLEPARRWIVHGAMAVFLAKALFELIAGESWFVDSDAVFEVAPAAHLIGGLTGLIVGRMSPKP